MLPSGPFACGAALFAALLTCPTAAQDKHPAFPERDALSPFRNPDQIYAPPERLFEVLRQMRAIAQKPNLTKEIAADGSETVDDPRWALLRDEALQCGIDAATLAQIMRRSRNSDDRATAFYGAFFVTDVINGMSLISHLPGEPLRRTREEMLPRAVAYVRAHIGQRFGDLSEERQKETLEHMPEIGSPVAKANGITRKPKAEDHLYNLRLVPFYQMLDLDEAIDQAQALWFLKEVFTIRLDLAAASLEPVLPTLRQLLVSDDARVREQAIGLLQAIGPKDLPAPPKDTDGNALLAWSDLATKTLFPPIRNVGNAAIQLMPSPERDAIVAAATAALATSSLGDAFVGQHAQGPDEGATYRGYRIARVPEVLEPLAIPVGAVISAINGVGIHDAQSLMGQVTEQLQKQGHPRRVMVEYWLRDELKAVEYIVL